MRALIQRVKKAQVHVDGDLIGSCNAGLLVLVCAMDGDTDDLPAKLAAKIAKLRIFKDENARMNRSLLDVGGEALIVSQFTLAADTSSGNRPGFSAAARPEDGDRHYRAFVSEMRRHIVKVGTGQFGADMAVSLINDGPVTIWLDTNT